MAEALTDVTRGLSEMPLVMVPPVDADAAGYGVGLVARCNVSAALTASWSWFPEVTNGLAPSLALSAAKAQPLGPVTSVAGPAALAARVDAVVAARLQHPAEVHAEIKRDLRDFREADPVTAIEWRGPSAPRRRERRAGPG